MNQDKIWAHFQNEGMDAFGQVQPRYTYLINRIELDASSTSTILNIGVGNGALEMALLGKGRRVSSIDPNEEAIKRLAELGVDAQAGYVQKMPFESGVFDYVVASEVLEHLNDVDLKGGMAEISRVLKPGGVFIGTVPFNERLRDNAVVCPHCGTQFHRWGHQQSFDKERLARLLEQPFVLYHMSCRTFVPWSIKPMRILKSGLKWALARLGETIADPHLYFECKKKN